MPVPDLTRRTTSMNTRDEILIAIGRIEGKLEAFATLSQRVSTLERWQWWLKGGWFATGHNVCVAVSRIPVEVVDDYLPCATSILDGRGRLLDFIGRGFAAS